MQTLNKEKISKAFQVYIADKPFLSRSFDIFEEPEEDLALYAAFTGSKHEIPTRIRRTVPKD